MNYLISSKNENELHQIYLKLNDKKFLHESYEKSGSRFLFVMLNILEDKFYLDPIAMISSNSFIVYRYTSTVENTFGDFLSQVKSNLNFGFNCHLKDLISNSDKYKMIYKYFEDNFFKERFDAYEEELEDSY